MSYKKEAETAQRQRPSTAKGRPKSPGYLKDVRKNIERIDKVLTDGRQ